MVHCLQYVHSNLSSIWLPYISFGQVALNRKFSPCCESEFAFKTCKLDLGFPISKFQFDNLNCESVVEMVVFIGAFFFELILKYPQSNKKTQHYFEAPWITTASNLCCFHRFWIHCFCEFRSLTTHHHKNLAFCVLLQRLRPCEVICMCMGRPRIGGGHTEVDHYLGHKCITPGLPLWTSWPFRKLGRTPTLTQLRLQQVNQPAYAASSDRATSHGGSN